MNGIEIHPFKPFVPENANKLILGSFPGREQTQHTQNENDWFYGSKRNQFWHIISHVYDTPLLTIDDKQTLFKNNGIATTDIFFKVRRTENNNLDNNLRVIEYNEAAIRTILQNNNINTVFFTSKFVEQHFRKLFPEITNTVCLPSPSPRYASMNKAEKIMHYKNKLLKNER